jgi:hypothetical protein
MTQAKVGRIREEEISEVQLLGLSSTCNMFGIQLMCADFLYNHTNSVCEVACQCALVRYNNSMNFTFICLHGVATSE